MARAAGGYSASVSEYLEVARHWAVVADFTKAISIDPNAIYNHSMRG